MVLLPALQCQHLLGCRPLLLLGHIQLILGLLQLTARLLRPAVGIRQLPTQLLQLTCQPLQLAKDPNGLPYKSEFAQNFVNFSTNDFTALETLPR